MKIRRFLGAILLAASAFLMSATASPLSAARPTAARLLPEKTYFMVSIPSVRELVQKFQNTNLGRMAQDPEMKPVIDTLYGTWSELVDTVKEGIGLSLDQILALPQGEITFAIIEPNADGPGFVVIFEAGDQMANARKLIDNAMKNLGMNRTEKTIGEVKCECYDGFSDKKFNLLVFEKDGALMFSSDVEAARQVLELWNEKKDARSLAENAVYASIANRCRGSRDEEPQLLWYADPIGFIKKMAETEAPMAMAAMALPALGLDGVQGAGGSVIYDTEQYDGMMHLHISLANPRSGVLKVIAFEPGESKPERWVPGDVASYATVHWNFKTSIDEVETIYDSFRGDGKFARDFVERPSKELDIDLKQQILPILEGRVTYVNWIQKPATLQSSQTLVALKLKDKDKAVETIQTVLDNIVKKSPGDYETKTASGKSYYCHDPAKRMNLPGGTERPPMPMPCFGIVEDYLMISNYPGVYEQVLATSADSSKSLAGELDYKIIASRIERAADGSKPALFTFQRPEETWRYMYDLATSEKAKAFLQLESQRNPFLKSINSSLEKQPLPPFSVLQKYFAPSGGIVTDDDTGIHFLDFSLKRKQ
jgi:hypothetical protein